MKILEGLKRICMWALLIPAIGAGADRDIDDLDCSAAQQSRRRSWSERIQWQAAGKQ